jgi:hypothetical protein
MPSALSAPAAGKVPPPSAALPAAVAVAAGRGCPAALLSAAAARPTCVYCHTAPDFEKGTT